jgi:hypothetical protein
LQPWKAVTGLTDEPRAQVERIVAERGRYENKDQKS